MPSQRDKKRWRVLDALMWPIGALNRLLNSKVMNVIYPVLLIIVGYIALDAQANITKTQDCFRDYLVKDAQAAKPRVEATAKKDQAAAESLISIGNLFTFILANQDTEENSEAEKAALKVFKDSQKALGGFEARNKELEEARKNFPPEPAPKDLCRNP